MSAPVKFLAVAVAGWVTVRAAASALAFPEVPASRVPTPVAAAPLQEAPAAAPPPVTYVPLAGAPDPRQLAAAGYGYVPAGYPMPYPPGPYPAAYPYPAPLPGYAAAAMRPVRVPVPVYYPVPMASMAGAAMPLPRQTPWARATEGETAATTDGPLSSPRAAVLDPAPAGGPTVVALTPPGPPRLDRWSLSTWSLMRQNSYAVNSLVPDGPGLAVGGQLGGSQAGARLTYRFTPRLSANLRVSGPVPTRRSRLDTLGGEAAVGVAWQPLGTVPLRLMAERRQRFGNSIGGRNAFAFLAEGGVYGQSLPLGFVLDGYGQSGIVSARQRDWFVDGGVTAIRPLFGRYSAGLGVWGGAQKGLNRLDVGPRLSARVTNNVRLSLDYRYRALGNARPGSGFAVALGSDF